MSRNRMYYCIVSYCIVYLTITRHANSSPSDMRSCLTDYIVSYVKRNCDGSRIIKIDIVIFGSARARPICKKLNTSTVCTPSYWMCTLDWLTSCLWSVWQPKCSKKYFNAAKLRWRWPAEWAVPELSWHWHPGCLARPRLPVQNIFLRLRNLIFSPTAMPIVSSKAGADSRIIKLSQKKKKKKGASAEREGG